MTKVKEVCDTVITKMKSFYSKSLKDKKLLELIFFSFLFVTLILSIMCICVAMSSNKYKSVMVFTEPVENEVKEINTGGFLTRDDEDETPSELPEENTKPNNNEDKTNNNNGSNNNNSNSNQNNPTTNNKPSTTTKPSTDEPNTNPNNNSSNNSNNENNNNSSNDVKDEPNSSENNNQTTPETITPPENIITISCSSSTKKNFTNDNDIYPASVVEQIVARFDAETKQFYQADVSFAIYSLKSSVNDLEALQSIYEKHFNKYASYFTTEKINSVYTSPTEAYINLKDLDYQTYHKAYGKETKTYDSFKYTFETGGYLCQT